MSDKMPSPLPSRITGKEDAKTLAEIKARMVAAADKIRAESEQPLRQIASDLRRVGVNVTSVWELVNMRESYPEAIPVLVHHLTQNHPDRVLEGIARALAVEDARPYWSILESTYKRWRDPTTLGAKAALASVLAITANDDTLTSLIGLVKDPQHGESRVFLVKALGRIRQRAADQTLKELENDELFAREVRAILRRRNRSRERKHRRRRPVDG